MDDGVQQVEQVLEVLVQVVLIITQATLVSGVVALALAVVDLVPQ